MPPAQASSLWHSDSVRLLRSGGRYCLKFKDYRGKSSTQYISIHDTVDAVLAKVTIPRADAESIVFAIKSAGAPTAAFVRVHSPFVRHATAHRAHAVLHVCVDGHRECISHG